MVRKESEKSISQAKTGVERVPLSSLRRGRKGKHFELMQQVVSELAELNEESALKVPLGSLSVKDLRSAVARAASAQKIKISSTSDSENLYVWKRL
jgi:hypothetical protein